jgi:hypothetical protein
MRILYFSFAFFLSLDNLYGQSIVSSAGSKSGILIGPDEDSNDFTTITYNSGDDRFSFNYKWNSQDKKLRGKDFPGVTGINFESGTTIAKNQASLISDNKWKGGLNFDLTLTRTWTNKKKSKRKETDTATGITHYEANLAQHTFFIRILDAFARINTYKVEAIGKDSTFISVNDPIQNTFTINPGFYSLHQWSSNLFFSWSVSTNVNFINKSVTKLSKTTALPATGGLFNVQDSSLVQLIGTQETFYSGEAEAEILLVPRVDLFLRYSLGKSKPVLGFIASYAPFSSSLSGVKTRNNFSFGPTIGLYTFPDQVLFALLNDFLQDKNGKYKYGLTFQASFPIKFK